MFTLWASVLVTYRWAAPFDCATECFRTDDVTGVVGAMESLPSLFWASVPAIENHPLVQTSTRAGLGFRAGVKDYRLTYFMDDYKVIDTDLLAAFRGLEYRVAIHLRYLVGRIKGAGYVGNICDTRAVDTISSWSPVMRLSI